MAAPPTAVESSLRTAEQRQSAVIVFEDVSIAFESNSVLNGISFQLNRGETKAIFGIAGAGKSTILKLAMGLVKPDSGRIWPPIISTGIQTRCGRCPVGLVEKYR